MGQGTCAEYCALIGKTPVGDEAALQAKTKPDCRAYLSCGECTVSQPLHAIDDLGKSIWGAKTGFPPPQSQL